MGPLLGAALVVAASACGTDAPKRTSVTTTATRTPQFSVSSTFSLPTLPTVGGQPASPSSRTGARPSDQSLAGRTILVDPGHNGGNASHPGAIDRLVDVGGFLQECDTVGSATTGGYPEHAFTFDVARRLTVLLEARGARVVPTRLTDTGVGPCIDQRAAAARTAHADLAVSLHADSRPDAATGFEVVRPGLLPGRDDAMVGPSASLADDLHDAMLPTGEPVSTDVGSDGVEVRTDLGALGLATVPTAVVEFGNLRNGDDALRLADPAARQRFAQALADGTGNYLSGR